MKEKICKNCKNFIQHYCKMDTRIFKINCGHCIYKKKLLPCDRWQEAEDNSTKDSKSIATTLENIYKRLDYIALYLSDCDEYVACFVDNGG